MKVAITSQYAQPEISAASRRISSLRCFLEERGHTVHIFAPKKTNIEEAEGVNRFTNFISLASSLRRFETVVSTMPPLDVAFKTALVCRMLRKRFLLDVRDPPAMAQVKLGNLKRDSSKYRVWRFMERFCLNSAEQVFFVSDYLKALMQKEFQLDSSRLHTAINGYDPRILKRATSKKIRNRLGIGKGPVIIYVGIVGGKELDQFIVKCEKTLKDEAVNVVFILVEDKDSQNLIQGLKKLVQEMGMTDRFHFLSNLDDEELYGYISASDLGLNPLPSNLNYCLPIKTFEYMACGIPVASKGPRTGPLAELHKYYDIGFHSTSWKDFDARLKEALENLKAYKSKGQHARRAAAENFNRDRGNEVFLKVLEGLE